jgi:hypothetical protein
MEELTLPNRVLSSKFRFDRNSNPHRGDITQAMELKQI